MSNDNSDEAFLRNYEADSWRVSRILTGCAILAVIAFLFTT